MNHRIIKLGLDSGMLNYVDHETPRHYFLCGNADEECLEKFAELIIRECISKYDEWSDTLPIAKTTFFIARHQVMKHFGIEDERTNTSSDTSSVTLLDTQICFNF